MFGMFRWGELGQLWRVSASWVTAMLGEPRSDMAVMVC